MASPSDDDSQQNLILGIAVGVIALVIFLVIGIALSRSGAARSPAKPVVAAVVAGAATPVLVAILARTAGGLGPAHYVAIVSLVGVAASIYMLVTRRGSLRA